MPHEHVLRERIIKNSPAATDNGLFSARDVPGSANTRGPIVVIRIVKTPIRDLNIGPGAGIKIGEIAVLLLNNAEIVVTQTEVQREFARHVDAVLNIPGIRIFKGVAVRIPLPLRTAVRNTGQKISEGIETERAAKPAIENLGYRRPAIFKSEFDVVLARFPGNAINVMPVSINALPGVPIIRA